MTFIDCKKKIMQGKFLLLNPFIAFNKDVRIGENLFLSAFAFLSLCDLHAS